MTHDAFDKRMRALECFHALRLLPGAWVVVRVDGRSFSRFTAGRFAKLFDAAFRDLMLHTAQALLIELQGCYAYTESDEISVLCPPEWALFDRKFEKVVSISASVASAAFTQGCSVPVHFDSRVWLGAEEPLVIDYFRWRQADAARCALHGWCYWTLRRAGHSVAEATMALQGASVSDKNELLFQHGINFNELPTWQRRGVGLYWQEYRKEGYNPRQQRVVQAIRRRITVDQELPMKDAYAQWLSSLLQRSRRPTQKRRRADTGPRGNVGDGHTSESV